VAEPTWIRLTGYHRGDDQPGPDRGARLAPRSRHPARVRGQPSRRRIVEVEDALAAKPGKRADRVALLDQRELEQLAWLWAGPLGRRLARVELRRDREGGPGLASLLLSLRGAGPVELAELIVDSPSLRCRFVRRDREWSKVELIVRPDARAGDLATELRLLEDLVEVERIDQRR